jgi:hypothetical protein
MRGPALGPCMQASSVLVSTDTHNTTNVILYRVPSNKSEIPHAQCPAPAESELGNYQEWRPVIRCPIFLILTPTSNASLGVVERNQHSRRWRACCADGKLRPADIIVVSTGFKVTEMAARLNITGRDGERLAEAWANDNPTAYLGLTVPSFPNFFTMLGPKFRSDTRRQRNLPVGVPVALHHGVSRRDDRARYCRHRRSPGRP